MNSAQLLIWAVLTTAVTVGSIPVRAQRESADTSQRAIVTNHEILQQSLDRLFARSPSWRNAVEEIQRMGRRAVVVTPRSVRVVDPRNGKIKPFDSDVIAEVQPLAEFETRVDAVVVVVNLDLLREHQQPLSTLGDFEDDLDRVLAHEIYGHAIPYLLVGDLSGKCEDPAKNERPQDACAIKRENEIRSELRLGHRTDSGIASLSLARRLRN